jgi:hypothetical protein
LRQSTPPVAGDCLEIGGVASAAIADLLDGPTRPAELIGSFPVAVYLKAAGGIVALVSTDGVRLPNAMVLSRADHACVVWHAASDPLQVGDGEVRLGPVRVIAGRWWDPVPRLGRVEVGLLAGRLDAVRAILPAWPDAADPAAGRLRTGREALASVLARTGDLAGTVRGLVGLGAGLTPAGDDLLAGVMAGLVVFGTALERPDARRLAVRIRHEVVAHASATTPVAADLAEHAARGALVQPAADLCRAIADQRPDADSALTPAVERLLQLGHTSGRDLAEGLLLGASTVQSRSSGHDTSKTFG